MTHEELVKGVVSSREGVSSEQAVRNEADGYLTITDVDFSGRIKIVYDGMEHPENGLTPSDAVALINIVKRMAMEGLRHMSDPLLWPWVLGILISKRRLNMAVKSFNDVSFKAMGGVFVKPEHMTAFGSELVLIIRRIAHGFGISPDASVTLSKVLGNAIDYDNAYRYRIQDIMASSSKKALIERPIREILKMAKTHKTREEHPQVSAKVRMVAIAACAMLCLPRFRRAFRNAIGSSDWDSMLPDERDRFWMCVRTGYRFMGKSDEERKMMINGLRVAKIRKTI